MQQHTAAMQHPFAAMQQHPFAALQQHPFAALQRWILLAGGGSQAA